MKMSKKAVNRLQNLTLVLLTLSALALLTRIPLFSESWDERVQTLLSVAPESSISSQTGDLSAVMPSLHLVSTGNSEYGRHTQLYLPADSPDLVNILPLFRDALGSAEDAAAVSDRAFQASLASPSLFLSFSSALPVHVVASWLGTEMAIDQTIVTMALTTEENNSAALYLCSESGSIVRYTTALTATAIYDCVLSFSPNGGSFAFESSYHALRPYTVLVSQTTSYQDLYTAVPDGYSAYNLLTALDFNAHNNFRYFETNGTEVIRESPRTLRISPDGTVVYNGDGFADSRLYRVSPTGTEVTGDDALRSAMNLAAALTDGTDASSLRLHSITGANGTWQIDFSYQAQGLPVLLPQDQPALSVTISNNIISSFTYRCRTYSPAETASSLLPPGMAAAIAATYSRAGLTVCYTDSGEDLLTARWLAD